jgi:hypothetical protein
MDIDRREFVALPAVALAGLAEAAGEPPWHQRIRRVWQVNFTEHDPAVLDVERWADYWAGLKVDTVLVSVTGIVAFYPSNVPYHRHTKFLNGRDLFGECCAAAKKRGIRVIARTSPDLEYDPPYILAVRGGDGWLPNIGVVRDALDDGLDKPVKPAIFVPYMLRMPMETQILVRAPGDPLALLHAVRQQIARVNPDQQVSDRVDDPESWIKTEPECADGWCRSCLECSRFLRLLWPPPTLQRGFVRRREAHERVWHPYGAGRAEGRHSTECICSGKRERWSGPVCGIGAEHRFKRICCKELRGFWYVDIVSRARPAPFQGRHFADVIIILCVSGTCGISLCYRDLEEIMAERGLALDHVTIWRWVQHYAVW